MAERRILTGDMARAAGYLPLARKLLALTAGEGIPLRRVLPDGTEIIVCRQPWEEQIRIHALAQEEEELFVADTGGHRIQVFSLQGVFRREFGQYGSGAGQFIYPRDVKVFGERVYVTDQGNSRIQVFSRQGKFLVAHALGYSADDLAVGGNRLVVAKTNNPVGFYVYDLELNLQYSHTYPPDPYLPSVEAGFYNVVSAVEVGGGKVFVAGNINNEYLNFIQVIKVFDLATGVFQFQYDQEINTTTEAMDYFAGRLYTLEITIPEYPHVRVREVTAGALPPGVEFGYFGPVDHSLTAPEEFYRRNNPNFNYGARALAACSQGIFVAEAGKDPAQAPPEGYQPDSDRIKQFSLGGTFIRNFGATGTDPGQFQRCFGMEVG